MTVIRNIESLRQSSRRCGHMFRHYHSRILVRPAAGAVSTDYAATDKSWNQLRPSSSPHLYQKYHSFSTFASSSDESLNPTAAAATAVKKTVPRVLEIASNEARQVVSKAPSPTTAAAATTTAASHDTDTSKLSSSNSNGHSKEAAEAARAMLALTSPTKPLAEAILSNKAYADRISILHHSLIQVTSWCISLIPDSQDEDSTTELLDLCVQLCLRSQDLSLPLHLFLYKDLITNFAIYSPKKSQPVAHILQVSALTVSALKICLEASFFTPALVAFVKRNQIPNAVLLCQRVMKDRHDIRMMEPQAAVQIVDNLPPRGQMEKQDMNSLLLLLDEPLTFHLGGPESPRRELFGTRLDLDDLYEDDNDDAETAAFKKGCLTKIHELLKQCKQQQEDILDEGFEESDYEEEDEFDEEDEDDDDDSSECDEEEEEEEEEACSGFDREEKIKELIALGVKNRNDGSFEWKRRGTALFQAMQTLDRYAWSTLESKSNNNSNKIDNEDGANGTDLVSDPVKLLVRNARRARRNREAVYRRNDWSWSFPDLTHQLVDANKGPILFTEEYELHCFREMSKEDDY